MHYVEVCSDAESEESDLNFGVDMLDQEASKAEGTLGSMVASLHGVKKYLTLRVVGQACGQDVMVLIDPRASHNFIYKGFVEKKGLRTKGFEGFRVSNTNGKLTLVDHIVEPEFCCLPEIIDLKSFRSRYSWIGVVFHQRL